MNEKYIADIKKFLIDNGYKCSDDQETHLAGVPSAYHKSGYSDIEVHDDEVVFVGDIGDYAHFNIDHETVYTLIGFMLVGRQLDISFVYNPVK